MTTIGRFFIVELASSTMKKIKLIAIMAGSILLGSLMLASIPLVVAESDNTTFQVIDTGIVDKNTGAKIFEVKITDPDDVWKYTVKRQFVPSQTMIEDCSEFHKSTVSFNAVVHHFPIKVNVLDCQGSEVMLHIELPST